LKNLEGKFRAETRREGNVLYVKVPREKYLDVARYMREQGFRTLIMVSAVDWLKKNSFEVYFVLRSPDGKGYVKVAADVPRSSPSIPSLSEIWRNAAMREREAWEMFGVTFEGNTMLKPLFLEDWSGPPPFRKDFDWREYVKEEYGLEPPKQGGRGNA